MNIPGKDRERERERERENERERERERESKRENKRERERECVCVRGWVGCAQTRHRMRDVAPREKLHLWGGYD